ncbi:rho GTPase-activating protein 20 isoform X2 [Clupea harengus]|uniref:Rho GTPase-activating protein 20 n=1 Tax=Clupea harengus TaxID=7950 RepID=A0A6P3WDK8_CLUHA|nr:rho GTPase-activating protein 20 isoform X2 [Clupea harengus]
METMSPKQQESINPSRCASLTGDPKMGPQLDKKRMKSMMHRRQSAPSLVISKALTRSRTLSRENFLMPVSPETCVLVQSYLTPTRHFVAHAYAQLKTGLQTQERHLFLFNDILLITKAKSSTNFKMKAQAYVSQMWIASCMDEVCEGSTSQERSFVMGWPTCNCVATFSTVEQKEKWLSLIKSHMQEEKEKDNPKTIPLKVFAKDVGNCAYAKTLAVSNSDSASEVIRLALQQFGIVGNVKDYQLWVSSKRDNAPYPLIGHEFPFSIQMSHLRPPSACLDDPKDANAPAETQVELFLDQLQSDNQCQFILKPSRVVVGQSFIVEPGQKPTKRRRSLISWAFWKGSTNQLDDPPPTPFFSAPGQLFGLPLNAVCHDDALPRPIMDILVFLYQEAPFTRGIFRRSAGAKACRDLRDRLDSGSRDVSLVHESIFVIAAVLKDFLRNIPGSLLSSDLYELWMGAMDGPIEGEESQLEAIQRLVGRLPCDNSLLLSHVLAVLHRVHLHSHDNQMNAFNLAICIAPSMLSGPALSSPELEGDGAKKVCELVRLMIEHCNTVMREDVMSLFSGFPQRCSNGDLGSDLSSYQMTDSSYDSLENELENDDLGSPFPAIQHPTPQPDSRSRDSVITLSDCDLDQMDTDPESPLPMTLLRPPPTPPSRVPQVSRPSSSRTRCPSEVPVLPGSCRLRRCSEPSIRNSTSSLLRCLESHTVRKGSYDDATDSAPDSEVDEVFTKHLSILRLDKPITLEREGASSDRAGSGETQRWKETTKKPPPLHLDASCSSLYSPNASPTRSSMSSLDSAFSQHSADYATSSLPLGVPLKMSGNVSPCSMGHISPCSPTQVSLFSSGPLTTSPRESPPKDPFDWSHLKSSHGLHPNSWLKRDRRLSLSRQLESMEDAYLQDGSSDGLAKVSQGRERRTQESAEPVAGRTSGSPPSYQQALLQAQHCKSMLYSPSDKPLTVRELRELHQQACSLPKASATTALPQARTARRPAPKSQVSGGDHPDLPQAMFYIQSARKLALHRHKSHSIIPSVENVHPRPTRRASEPIAVSLGLDQESTIGLERLHRQALRQVTDQDAPQNPGLRISDVEPSREFTEARFCLSPTATKAVRDYFSLHSHEDPHSSLKKSQEVALAIVQGKREWNRRCSDPRLEDFDQLLFAEESYV